MASLEVFIASPPRTDPDRIPDIGWSSLIDGLVDRNGSLAATAELLAAHRQHRENVESIERALRRLRQATGDGGTWGRRVIEVFGLPAAIRARLRWMGHYHSRFTDLPVPIAHDLLRHWDRASIRLSGDAALLDLGHATVALRSGRPDDAARALERVWSVGRRMDALTRTEACLVGSFLHSRTDDARSLASLEDAEGWLGELPDGPDAANLKARTVDQRAYRLNRPRTGDARPHEALALYDSLPVNGPPFANVRRSNGRGWSLWRLGRREEALEAARSSVEIAGDAGSLRLRAMALRLLAVCTTGEEAHRARQRSEAIAHRLEDELLLDRFR